MEILTIQEAADFLRMNRQQIYEMTCARSRARMPVPIPLIRVNGNIRFKRSKPGKSDHSIGRIRTDWTVPKKARQSSKPQTATIKYVGHVATDHQTFLAILERVASFTVGIAVSDNTGIGTGTLINAGNKRAVLTAEHVIHGAEPQQIRFWCKPNAPLIEKPAKDVSTSELRKLTAGIRFPIETVIVNSQVDLALLTIESGFELPTSAEFFDLSKSHALTNSGTTLDGLSLVCFGFPVDNSKLVMNTGNRGLSFLGCTSNVCYYDAKLNTDLWDQLPSSISRDKNFLLKYNRADESIEPPGFSGSGVWINASTEGQVVWNADPLLIGVVHRYFKKFSVLMATNLVTIFEFVADLAGSRPSSANR